MRCSKARDKTRTERSKGARSRNEGRELSKGTILWSLVSYAEDYGLDLQSNGELLKASE